MFAWLFAVFSFGDEPSDFIHLLTRNDFATNLISMMIPDGDKEDDEEARYYYYFSPAKAFG